MGVTQWKISIEGASLASSACGRSVEEMVVLDGKLSCRSKEYVFLIEQLSRGSERTSMGLESYSTGLLEGRQSPLERG